jgi:membrane-associated PAP2 superfamily phosphatase
LKKKSFLILFVFTILIFKTALPGQIQTEKENSSKNLSTSESTDQKNEKKITWYKMFTDIPSDYGSLFQNFLNKNEIPAFLTIGSLTGALMIIDQQGWKYDDLLFKKSHAVHNVSNIMVNLGDGKYQLLAAAAFALPGVIFHNKTALKTASNITEALISTGVSVQILKRITGRQSPSASTENGGDWDPFPSLKQYQKNQASFYSFPSGHVSTATAVITVIANNYPNLKWIKPIGYPLLAVLSFSLVNKGMHWYSDFPLAFFLGYSFGNIIAPKEKNADSKTETHESHLYVAPSYLNKKLYLGAVYNF